MTPDPGGIRTADPKNPGSWNRYAYVNGDPVNFNDPHGAFACPVGAGEYVEWVNCEYGPAMTYPRSPADFGADYSDAHGDTSGPTFTASGNRAHDRVRQQIYTFDNDSVFTPEILDCISGIESSWNPNAASGTHKGLYGINPTTWYDSGTPLDYAVSAT